MGPVGNVSAFAVRYEDAIRQPTCRRKIIVQILLTLAMRGLSTSNDKGYQPKENTFGLIFMTNRIAQCTPDTVVFDVYACPDPMSVSKENHIRGRIGAFWWDGIH